MKAKTFEDLIVKIWDKGQMVFRSGPRFCLHPNAGIWAYDSKTVTHYDFVWVERGLCAKLLLYQGSVDGKIIYGAVMDEDIRKIGEINFLWNIKEQKFEE